jgi:hypothetical protein
MVEEMKLSVPIHPTSYQRGKGEEYVSHILLTGIGS